MHHCLIFCAYGLAHAPGFVFLIVGGGGVPSSGAISIGGRGSTAGSCTCEVFAPGAV